jgi:hypothetical protein
MQNEIVAKLNRQLEHGFEREADVVYVMAEVRKLFEHVRTARKYPVLAFYSNWALHTRIGGNRGRERALSVWKRL